MGSSTLQTIDKNRINRALTLLTSYTGTNTEEITELSPRYDYEEIVTFYGVPLSVSKFVDIITDPSLKDNVGTFYSLNVIENDTIEDATDTNTAQEPSAKTFSINANRLSASKINNKYYLNIAKTIYKASPQKIFTFMGIPMAQGKYDELILTKSSYTIEDIDLHPTTGEPDLINIMIGGTPLTVGRVGSKYYLIVKVL
jgi:hypothetical protein